MPRLPFLNYGSILRESQQARRDSRPSRGTVTQPNITTVDPLENLKQRTGKSYDSIALSYKRWTVMYRGQRFTYAIKLIDLLKKEQAGITLVRLHRMRALEVGCGDGTPVAEILLSEDVNVVGVDISETQIARCRAHFPKHTDTRQASWIHRDMMELRYPWERFDVVIALYCLLHLPREEQAVFLKRAAKWLRPGGFLLFNFPQEENEGEVEEHWLGLEEGWVYRSSWGEEKLMSFVEGLEDMEVVVKGVTEAEGRNGDPKFVWVIAQKSIWSNSLKIGKPYEGQRGSYRTRQRTSITNNLVNQ
ncbi:S-adenosyl-L-methionine-dependent methyltransferase [Chaetomium tenue]|uniref:S-adenosyl-L-methionine-dependent methyltransferase n=1 Tax=Chaetomium tenue TaxID=1854479 RepID=A0ACB7P0K2_9PEZI|nr:S-adenosyl-L-methionine-dependent methyltransferase [Chaetomium globosum]